MRGGGGGGDADGAEPADTSGDGPTGTVTIDACDGSAVSPSVVDALAAANAVDPSMRWLYPYDGTVFPFGIVSPVLQWDPQSGGTEALRIHLASTYFEYVGCFVPSEPMRWQIPQDVWDTALAQNLGTRTDILRIELTTYAGGIASGPILESWIIARGSLKGTVYYNTYDSPLAGNVGAVMRISPGASAPEAYLTTSGGMPGLGPCTSCHVLSADGSTMIAALHAYGLSTNYESYSYDLQATPGPQPAIVTDVLDEAAFSALYPDGSFFMRNGSPSDTSSDAFYPHGEENITGMIGIRTSSLFETRTGAPIAATGWDVEYAKMPMFSPDGKHLAFNHFEASGGHTLAMMDFDNATRTFSNYQVLFEDPNGYPGWPMFTPDSEKVIFVLDSDVKNGSCASFSISFTDMTINCGLVAQGDLYIVETGSLAVTGLDSVNGFAGGGPYVPQGDRDLHLQFYPTVMPVSAGGYFWVFFTSRRTYGNLMMSSADDSTTKKIWVAAIDISTELGSDPSHPPFYLSGQELESGNIRAFSTLNPCKSDGESCETGIDCCTGFCTDGICGPPQECADTDERCETRADCCDPHDDCIGGYCAVRIG